MPSPASVKVLKQNRIYQSDWVDLYVDKVQFPNGAVIEEHHRLDFKRDAVMMIARDEDGRYLMVKVYRYPIDRTEWEFPAGRMEEGEEIIQAGERELLEETGYLASNHEILYSYYPLCGSANVNFHIVRCQASGTAGEVLDTIEVNEVRWFTENEIWQMIRDNEMLDGYSLTAFLFSQHR